MMRRPIPTQQARAAWLVIYAAGLMLLNRYVTGSWLPPVTPKGLWFYTAAVSLLLGDLVVNPYYVGPRDSIAVAVPAAVAIWYLWPQQHPSIVFRFTLGFCLLVVVMAILSLLLSRVQDSPSSKVGRWLKEFLQTIGHPKVVLSSVFGLSLAEYHAAAPSEIALVGGVWAVLVGVQPERPLYWSWQKLRMKGDKVTNFGTVAGYQPPNIVLVRNDSSESLETGDVLVCRDAKGPALLLMALDNVGRDESPLLRCLTVSVAGENEIQLQKLCENLDPDTVGLVNNEALASFPKAAMRVIECKTSFIGTVAQLTDIETTFIEIVKDTDIEEGHLVQTEVHGKKVLYQIVNGLTKEEVVFKKHAYGYAQAEATKVGIWDAASQRFIRSKWLPNLNTPVLRAPPSGITAPVNAIGQFPGSTYPIAINCVGDLVTHNTAILGILGVGKSMLAIELVERMLAEGIKVVCLDLTNQYAVELCDWIDPTSDEESVKRVIEASELDRDQLADSPEKGGSFPNLKHALSVELRRFMNSNEPLKIINPARFAATRQDTEPKSYRDDNGDWQRSAPLWSVTPVQVTQVIAETLLYLVQDQMSENARVCLVLEEAHSLVPEFSNLTNDADRNASNGTARAILQGRKYGFGCLVVTQRTANVTKTILNQCNTVFAMRTFDDTGKSFLANYLGSKHADSLTTLAEREAVFFGRASACENPVRVRLNDRAEFLTRFRAANPIPHARNADQSSQTTGESVGLE